MPITTAQVPPEMTSVTTSFDALNASMYEEVEALGAAELFEGDGKWGMALALYGQLIAMGLEPDIRYRPGHGTPVWVEACGVAFDFRGALRQIPEFGLSLMEDWIPGMAARFDKLSPDGVIEDFLKAEAIVRKAFPPVIGSSLDGEPEEAG